MYTHIAVTIKYTLCNVTQLVEKMSSQPTAKTSRQVKPQPNKEQELYEHVEMQEQQSHYMTINRPNRVEVEDKSQLAGQISTKIKRGKCVVIALIAVFLVIALVVSLVAVIIYSPLVSGGDTGNILSRIQQLEETNTAKESQIASMQNLIQISTLAQNNLRQDLDRLHTVNLYKDCIQETSTCHLATLSNYWIACNTGFVSINPRVSIHIASRDS